MKSTSFWNVTPCTSSKIQVYRRRRVRQASNQQESNATYISSTLKMKVTCSSESSIFFVAGCFCLLFDPQDGGNKASFGGACYLHLQGRKYASRVYFSFVCLAYSSTLKIEDVLCPETLITPTDYTASHHRTLQLLSPCLVYSSLGGTSPHPSF
jgi:hypothetical protein